MPALFKQNQNWKETTMKKNIINFLKDIEKTNKINMVDIVKIAFTNNYIHYCTYVYFVKRYIIKKCHENSDIAYMYLTHAFDYFITNTHFYKSTIINHELTKMEIKKAMKNYLIN